MRKLILAIVMMFVLAGCEVPEGWIHYKTREYDGGESRDAYQYNIPGTDKYPWAVIFTEGSPEFIDCTKEEC